MYFFISLTVFTPLVVFVLLLAISLNGRSYLRQPCNVILDSPIIDKENKPIEIEITIPPINENISEIFDIGVVTEDDNKSTVNNNKQKGEYNPFE
jgi:hypothetical protein